MTVFSVLGNTTLFDNLTIASARTDGSSSDSATGSHIALKITNGDGENIKVSHQRMLMMDFDATA